MAIICSLFVVFFTALRIVSRYQHQACRIELVFSMVSRSLGIRTDCGICTAYVLDGTRTSSAPHIGGLYVNRVLASTSRIVSLKLKEGKTGLGDQNDEDIAL